MIVKVMTVAVKETTSDVAREQQYKSAMKRLKRFPQICYITVLCTLSNILSDNRFHQSCNVVSIAPRNESLPASKSVCNYVL